MNEKELLKEAIRLLRELVYSASSHRTSQTAFLRYERALKEAREFVDEQGESHEN